MSISSALRIGCLCIAVAGCSSPAAAPATQYVLRMSPALAANPNMKAGFARLPNVSVQTVQSGGASITSLADLRRGRIDVATVLADVAYLAYAGQLNESSPFTELRGMAMLDVTTFHVLVGANTHIDSIRQLKGKHVSLGPIGGSNALIAEALLKANGMSLDDVRGEQLAYPETIDRLLKGDFDAAFVTEIMGNDPVTQAMRGGARLLNLDGPMIEALREQRPFLRRTLVPKDTYPRQPINVHTLGVDRVMICRADLDQEIVYRLLEGFFAPRADTTPPADLERAPATPFPLHAGAARYYRQRELSR